MLKKIALLVVLIGGVVVRAQTMAAVYYSPSVGVWQPLTTAAAFGQINPGTPLHIQAYSQASSGAQCSPCTFSGSGGSGTVPAVSWTSANGVTGPVATPTPTPAISLTLGAI